LLCSPLTPALNMRSLNESRHPGEATFAPNDLVPAAETEPSGPATDDDQIVL
jgi:hypothetical protein